MADNPLYYGNDNKPMYYGARQKMAYGGRGPVYYGKSQYGGVYGGMYGGLYGTNSGGEGDGTVIGTITLSRMLRVFSQRWLSVFVFLLLGLLVSFAIYKISPTVYEAKSEFTMDMRRSTGAGLGALENITPDYGSTYIEIFNTRISDWRSEKIVARIIQLYRASEPTSTVTDEEIIESLTKSELELMRNSRIITISVRSRSPKLCAALANAYAEAIETFTDEENRARCDKAVSQIHSNVEKKRREVDKVAKQLLDFRTANKIDNLRSTRETLDQALKKATTDILVLETEQTQLIEWEKMLKEVQKDPRTYGSLSVNVPRAQEIATEFAAYQLAEGEYQKLLFSFTDQHPDVITKKKEQELSRQRFIDAAARALLTGQSTLKVARNQLANLRQRQDELRNELASVEQRIVLAESGLKLLETQFDVSNRVLEGLILDENKARIEAESNNEIVRQGRHATVPLKPILPSAIIIFGLGTFLSLGLGLLFVLVVDNLEDTVVNLADIERRLSLKVLSVLPHVQLKKREEVAKILINDKYSRFAEEVATLRNLLDSPRYDSVSKCMLFISTQPGEGKTIVSSSTAIAYAQSGRKVLHVDFDLRRPRLAKIWNIDLTEETSFSHAMHKAKGRSIDFAQLVNHTELKGLDVIASRDPDGLSPSEIFGSAVIGEFFEWARANYDRIIVDSPPYGVVGDVVSLSVLVDSVIIMCCPDRTHFKPIQHCSISLTEAGANILGVVVNDVEVSTESAFFASRYRYGYYGRYRKSESEESSGGGESEGEKLEFNDDE